jgi:hypothetical protein
MQEIITFKTEQSPLEEVIFSTSQETVHHLWNPNIHYHAHKNLKLVLLSQMNAVHNLT